MWFFTKRPVNVVPAFTGRFAFGCLEWILGCFELICWLLIGGFYGFCDELPLIVALFKLYSQVFAWLLLPLQVACKRFCRVFKINCN